MFSMNFFSGVWLIESALPFFIHAKKGVIIAISSIAALEALPTPLPYGAAKAALLSYLKNLSRQVGAHGIRVNAVAPGNVFVPGGTESITPVYANGIIQTTGFIANAAVATVLGSVGPTGSHTAVQEWLEIKDSGGTIRYVPGF
jgi:NAD(P)-dependent dehydrogenase (short-subunit alcohol dehydrogenase family)